VSAEPLAGRVDQIQDENAALAGLVAQLVDVVDQLARLAGAQPLVTQVTGADRPALSILQGGQS
jgi:hypothetical protein